MALLARHACIPNLGPRERAKRLRFGLIALALSLAGATALLLLGAPRPLRLALFLPFWLAAVGIFQATEKT